MAVIAVIASEDNERQDLRLAVEELGHRAASAPDIKRVLEIVREHRPRLVVVAQSPGERTAESLLGEMRHEAPMTPVIVAMSGRKAARAVELMKAGAFEVLSPPWTPENLSGALNKALRFRGTRIDSSSAAPKRGILGWAVLAAAVALFAAGGAWLSGRIDSAKIADAPVAATEWDLPYSHPAGLAIRGTELWVSDWFSQTIHRHDMKTKAAVRSIHLPREIPGAIAFAADALWVAAHPRRLIKHLLDDELTTAGVFTDLRPQTVGAAYDGLYLWTCDAANSRLYKRILDERLSVVAAYDYPGGIASALAYDGKSLWSLDTGNRELVEHDIAEPTRILRRVPLNGYRSGKWKPTGLAFDGARFWTVAESQPRGQGPGRLFVHELP